MKMWKVERGSFEVLAIAGVCLTLAAITGVSQGFADEQPRIENSAFTQLAMWSDAAQPGTARIVRTIAYSP